MLIGYKLLGNEVLLPMKFLCSNGFRFVDAVGLKQASENKNTKRSTIYCTYLLRKKEEIEIYEVLRLNEALAQFFAERRKENGTCCTCLTTLFHPSSSSCAPGPWAHKHLHVACVWPARSTHVATSCNNVARCCVEILQAFGQAFGSILK